MDAGLDKRLREIEDLLGSVAVHAGEGGLDVLDLRNELEVVETRLMERIDDALISLSRLAELVETRLASVQTRVDETAQTVQDIYSELPTA